MAENNNFDNQLTVLLIHQVKKKKKKIKFSGFGFSNYL